MAGLFQSLTISTATPCRSYTFVKYWSDYVTRRPTILQLFYRGISFTPWNVGTGFIEKLEGSTSLTTYHRNHVSWKTLGYGLPAFLQEHLHIYMVQYFLLSHSTNDWSYSPSSIMKLLSLTVKIVYERRFIIHKKALDQPFINLPMVNAWPRIPGDSLPMVNNLFASSLFLPYFHFWAISLLFSLNRFWNDELSILHYGLRGP